MKLRALVLCVVPIGVLGGLAPQRPLDRSVPSILVIDLAGNGVTFSSAQGGVELALNDRSRVRTAWTTGASDDAVVAYDQNRNGRIDGFSELLGGVFAIGPPDGFEFLRLSGDGYSTPAQLQRQDRTAKRPDGRIDARDALYHRLILWTDTNHNGKSEEIELQSVGHARLEVIDLSIDRRQTTDSAGNLITGRSQASIRRTQGLDPVEVLSVRLAR